MEGENVVRSILSDNIKNSLTQGGGEDKLPKYK